VLVDASRYSVAIAILGFSLQLYPTYQNALQIWQKRYYYYYFEGDGD
jgi:hypothetical protein